MSSKTQHQKNKPTWWIIKDHHSHYLHPCDENVCITQKTPPPCLFTHRSDTWDTRQGCTQSPLSFPLHWGELFAWRTDRTKCAWRMAFVSLVKNVDSDITVGTLETRIAMIWEGWPEPWAAPRGHACICTYMYMHSAISNLLPHQNGG